MRSLREPIDATLGRLAEMGANPDADEEMRLRKALLVIGALILRISFGWGALQDESVCERRGTIE